MGIVVFNFIIIALLVTLLIFYWVLYRRLTWFHKDVKNYEMQIKNLMEDLEKKINSQESDVGSVKDDFKHLQAKILDFECLILKYDSPRVVYFHE